ncbi:MAG TPA: hypothetical protein VEQ63_12855 [Bryobacteraceae bacterium]|nr:hypothetical protein [Bryobacteraceae bacterium]
MRLIVSALLLAFSGPVSAQIIDFESNGLRYQALTRQGLTIMIGELPSHIRDYSVLQVAISNGSTKTYTLKPEDFIFTRSDGTATPALPARFVVRSLLQKASRNDVIRLVTAYEGGLYGNRHRYQLNGYEERRQAALAEVGSTKIKAAATASAVAFVQTKLLPGQSTDGAIFYSNPAKSLGPGVIQITTSGLTFEFPLLSSN